MRRRLSGNHPESPLLLTVSRLASEKNVNFLTEVLQRVPQATLAIVGGGPQRQELERRFAKYKAHFVGYLRGEELASAYASADAFVYASETETMGNVILEAMASGLPVIAARAGGIPSLVQHGTDGLLFTPRNADEAASYVHEILESPTRHERMSAAALVSVRKRTWQNSGDTVRSHYRQVIAEFAARSAALSGSSRPGVMASLATKALVQMFEITAPQESKLVESLRKLRVQPDMKAGVYEEL